MKFAALIIVLLVSASLGLSQSDGTKPFVLGIIDRIHSAELSEDRTLNIYLPDGYNKEEATTYPVIYLLDGSADEDFIHVAGLVQYNSFPWVNRVPRSIVVGIANVDRKRDFTFPTSVAADKKRYPSAGHSDKFIAFIENELQPFIERKYRAGKVKTLIGESLGGLLAAEILLKKRWLFDKYIIISPSLWWDDGSLIKRRMEQFPDRARQTTDVYIGVGKEGLGPSDTPHVGEVDANLFADQLRRSEAKDMTVYFDYLPLEDHATIGHQAIYNAFRILNSVRSNDKK